MRLVGILRGRITPCIAFAILVLVPTDAIAQVRTTTPTGALTVWPEPTPVFAVVPLGAGFGLSDRDVQSAVASAARTWSSPNVDCTRAQLRVANSPSSLKGGQDGINSIMVLTDRWCSTDPKIIRCYDPSVLAMTTVHRTQDGRILEADIEINAVYYRWKLPDGRASADRLGTETRDLQSLLTHEFGHALGLAHPCSVGDETVLLPSGAPAPDCSTVDELHRSTMYPLHQDGKTIQRLLGDDEKRFLCEVYPAARPAATLPTSAEIKKTHRGCSTVPSQSTPGSRVPWFLLAAIFVAAFLRVPTARVRENHTPV